MNPDHSQQVESARVPEGPPTGYFIVVDSRQDAAEVVSLTDFMRTLRESWKLVVILSLLGAGFAAGIAMWMTPIFRAETLLAPVEAQGSGAGGALRGQLGGLAALAGIDAGGGVTARDEAVATLSSKGFARDFIVAENLLPALFPDEWDAQAKRWRDGSAPPLETAVKRFTQDVRFISEDRRTGLVVLAVEARSAAQASQWANRMVERVNERMRELARQKAELSIEYLNKELSEAGVLPLQQAIYRLIEEQVNNAMLANVQREYAFRVLDPAVAPVVRARPKRTMMTVVGGVVGGFIAVMWLLVRMHVRGPAGARPARG